LLDPLLDTEPGRHEALLAADELGIAGVARLIRDEDASSTPRTRSSSRATGNIKGSHD